MRSIHAKPLLAMAVMMAAGLLAGCASEVDKCVDAQVKAWQAEQERLAQDVASGRRQPATSNNDIGRVIEAVQGKVVPDNRSKAEVAAEARLRCLQVTEKR